MVKKLLLLFNYLLFVAVIQAAPVGRSDAQKKAQQFVAGKLAAARGTSQTQAGLSLVKEEGSCYYIFNVGSHDGFVIVSGDDRAPEILGYSDSGSFDENNMPDNMKAWLQGYAADIQVLKSMPEVAEARTEQPKRTANVSPLLQTTWDQGNPYNLKVPQFVNGAPSVTGCVATAMAQVLYYTAMHSSDNFLDATTKEIPAYQCWRGWTVGETTSHVQVPDVPVTTFQWNNMLLDYSTGATVDQKNAVADLMLCCGASVEMDYANEVKGSQASASRIPDAFQTYFGFDGNVRYIRRSDYTIGEWEDIIYEEINSGRPVLYSGQTSANTGHSFVCDGYDSNGLFHFNWGWGGNCDGYFVLWSANPHGGGIGASNGYDGYSMTQDAVIGIKQPTGSVPDETKCLTVKEIKVFNNVLTYDRSSKSANFVVPICAVVGNSTSAAFSVELGIGLYNGNEFDSFLLQDNTYSYSLGGNCPIGNFYGITNSQYEFNNFYFGANKTGTYQIIPISRESGTGTWLKDRMSDQYYIEATMTETQLTLIVKPIVNLAVTNVVYTGLKMAGLVQEVKVSVQNSGSDYNGNLYLLVNDNYVSGEGVALKAGQTTDVFFHYVPSVAGTDSYKVCLSSNGENSLANGTQAIAAYSATDNIDLTMSVDIHNDIVESNVLGNQFVATVTATNNSNQVYQGAEIGLTYQYTLGDYDCQAWTNMLNVRLLPGESISGVLSFDMAQGLTYTVKAYQVKNSSRVTNGTTYQYTAAVTSLDLQGVSSVTDVSTLNAPNCLFLVGNESTLTGKNVIKGTTATQVELSDGADFTAPIDFTANEISYSRDITVGTDGTGSGWTTIVLPFEVDKVYAVDGSGQTEIDWFHSNTDSGKNFWLRRFVSDGVGTVSFDYTDKIDANTPYIIAVPGSHWGAEFDLTGKTLKFVGSNKNIKMNATAEKSGTNYNFVGTTTRQILSDVYALNNEGSSFVLSADPVLISPFRTYFTPKTGVGSRLIICSADEQPTQIAMPEKEPLLTGDIYTLDGRKVKAISQKGVYIINGKKVIK